MPPPTVTVVMTLLHHRGKLPLALDAWVAQTYPRAALEMLCVGNGGEPAIEALVEARLGRGLPAGRVLRLATGNEMALYDHAARSAGGDWLLFTEPHCIPRPDCVAELIGDLTRRGLAGGCVRTLDDGNDHPVARVERRMYDEDFAVWSADADWRKFTKRGFALRRAAYLDVGGLETDYLRFAELALAARLHQAGHAVGHVPGAAVLHYNSTDLGELLDYVREFRYQAARYADRCDPALRHYVANLSSGRRAPPPAVARAMRRAIGDAVLRGVLRPFAADGGRLALALAAAAAAWTPAARLPGALRYALARARFAWPWGGDDRRFAAFMDIWCHLGDWAEMAYRPEAGEASEAGASDGQAQVIRPGEEARGLYGFHAREEAGGRPFRWTSPAAAVVARLPAGDCELSLDTGGLLPPGRDCLVHLGGRYAGRLASGGPPLRLAAGIGGGDGPQVLSLIAPPLRPADGRETRALGLPLFAIHLRPLG